MAGLFSAGYSHCCGVLLRADTLYVSETVLTRGANDPAVAGNFTHRAFACGRYLCGVYKMSKQSDVMDYYFAGGYLTTISCRTLFKTTELRRINSRINKLLNIIGQSKIEGKFLVHNGVPDDFKTYGLTHSKAV